MSADERKARGGRPKVADEPVSVTVRIDASMREMADSIAADLDQLGLPGMRTTRGEVLRAALVRGIEAMRADVDARLRGPKLEDVPVSDIAAAEARRVLKKFGEE